MPENELVPYEDAPGMNNPRQLGVLAEVYIGQKAYKLTSPISINEFRLWRKGQAQLAAMRERGDEPEAIEDAEIDLNVQTIVGPLARSNQPEPFDADLLKSRVSPQFAEAVASFLLGRSAPFHRVTSAPSNETPSTGPNPNPSAPTETAANPTPMTTNSDSAPLPAS